MGITFIITLALGYWSFMMLAKGSCAGQDEGFHVHAYFNDATGLVEKSRVQIAGLNVGHIASRELNVRPPRPELVGEKRFAKITVALNQGTVLYSNARVFKKSASLLGEFYLEIDPGTYEWIDDRGKLHRGERLHSGAEIKFVIEGVTTDKIIRQTDQLFSQINDVVPVLKNIAQDIRAFTKGPLHDISKNINDGIQENRDSIHKMISNLEAITGDVRRITNGADKNVATILEDIRHITTSLRSVIGSSDEDIKDSAGKLKTGLDKLNSSLTKLDSAMGNIDEITKGLNEGKGSVGRLLKDEALVDDVEGIVHDAGGFVKSITGLQTVVGLRSEYNFQAGSIKTYFSVEIRPRPDKYYLIELIDDPRGRRTVTQRHTRTDDPSKPSLVREETIETTEAFRLSFMFAKRIRFLPFTLRIGIKESTGGVGIDTHLFDDHFTISSDFFDFRANVWPRLKVLAAWEFFKRLYVVGGADDIFNDRPLDGSGGGRDFFAGFQLRFNDEDLKSLLLFGGSSMSGAVK